jgi:hypothetical protein
MMRKTKTEATGADSGAAVRYRWPWNHKHTVYGLCGRIPISASVRLPCCSLVDDLPTDALNLRLASLPDECGNVAAATGLAPGAFWGGSRKPQGVSPRAAALNHDGRELAL